MNPGFAVLVVRVMPRGVWGFGNDKWTLTHLNFIASNYVYGTQYSTAQ